MKVIRIYPDLWSNKKYFYCQVRVFDTRLEMLKDMEDMGYEIRETIAAQVSGIEARCNGRLTGKFSFMWLNIDDLEENGMELLVHECVHVAMRHILNLKIELKSMKEEEILCYAVGSLSNQLNKRLKKLGINLYNNL